MGTCFGMAMSTKRDVLMLVVIVATVVLLLLLLPLYHPHADFGGKSIHRHFIWDCRHVH